MKERFLKSDVVAILFFWILAALIFFGLQAGYSLRLDESQTIWQTSQSLTNLLDSLSRNVHVPFYHISFHFWQAWFGNGVVVGRLYSLLFMLATIPSLFYFTKRYFSREAAFFATLLFTLSPFVTWFGGEIRMYTLIAFLTVNAHFLYLELLHHPRLYHWFLYTALAIVGVYSHYFFWFVLGIHFLYFFFHRPLREQKMMFIKFLTVALVVVVSFLPWANKVLNTPGSVADPLLSPPKSIDVFNVFTNFFFGFQSDYVNSLLISIWPLVFTLSFFTLRKGFKLKKEFYFLVIAAFVPILLAYVASFLVQPMFLSRYLIITLPPLFIAVSVLVTAFEDPIKNITRVILVALVFSMLLVQASDESLVAKEDYRQATEYINRSVTPKDVVIVSAPFAIYPFQYYYDGYARVETIPQWNRFSGEALPAFSRRRLPREIDDIRGEYKHNAYMLMSYDQGYEEVIEDYMDNNFERIEKIEFSPRIRLFVYRVGYYSDRPELNPFTQQTEN